MQIELMEGISLVVSQGEYGYQEVIDDFENASIIRVITFNISKRHRQLVNQLQELSKVKDVKIITNIPSRFPRYTSRRARSTANQNIDVYLDVLGSEDNTLATLFNFNSHTKIILTENIAYIGSQNYSEESVDNIETGVIIRNAQIVDNIINRVLPIFEDGAIEYQGSDIARHAVMISNVLVEFERIYHEIFSSLLVTMEDYVSHPHYHIPNPHYHIPNPSELVINWSEGYILREDVEELESCLFALDDVLDEIEQDLETIDTDDIQELTSKIGEDSSIYELARFSEQKYAEQYMEEYMTEIDEDNLDEYATLASEAANLKKEELMSRCQSDVFEVKDTLDRIYCELERKVIQVMTQYEAELQRNVSQIRNT